MSKINIDVAIAAAASSKLDKDYWSFFELAKGVEFFFNYRESDGQMTVPFYVVGDNIRAVVFYTSKEAARRQGKYAGIPWERGLEMIVRMPGADGLVVQNNQEAWVAMAREKIAELLMNYKGAGSQ